MAQVSAALYIPTSFFFNCVLSIFLSLSFSFPICFYFLFYYFFFHFQLFCPFLTILFILSFVFDFNGLVIVLCFVVRYFMSILVLQSS